jgi:hypothetical protein
MFNWKRFAKLLSAAIAWQNALLMLWLIWLCLDRYYLPPLAMVIW